MREKSGKESTVTRYVDAEGQQQIVCLYFCFFFQIKSTLIPFIHRI
jgi:hypothetical protein